LNVDGDTEGQAFDPRIIPPMTPRATPAATVPLDCGSTATVAMSPMAAAVARTVSFLFIDPQSVARGRCGGHVAVHGRDKYLTLLACGGVALGSQ
jgi:hypothetical protein